MSSLLRKPANLIELNASCLCIELRKAEIDRTIISRFPSSELTHELACRKSLFAQTAIFLSDCDIEKMQMQISAIESLVQSSSTYREGTLARSDRNLTEIQPNARGLFMGYDFHITEDGPRLIEVNTNAGGGFLMAAAMGVSQDLCCGEPSKEFEKLEAQIIDSFRAEWRAAGRTRPLETLAIIDKNPTAQYLYPELLVAQQMLQRAGVATSIVDPEQLAWVNGQMLVDNVAVDMIYNRLTDFSLTHPDHKHLQQALINDHVVVSPSPRHHILFANKENLTVFSDPEQLIKLGVNADELVHWKSVPRTVKVTLDRAAELWSSRKRLFFKPTTGYGSRAVYRGDKLTKRVWAEILAGSYIAQELIPPTVRGLRYENGSKDLKFDIRVYTYAGEPLLYAGRAYSGQTTNFRTEGGGLAPVIQLPV